MKYFHTFFLLLLLSFCVVAQPASAVTRLLDIPRYAPVEEYFFKTVCVLRSGSYVYVFTYDSRGRNIAVTIRDLRNGQYRDAQGNIVSKKDPAGHIPLDQYPEYKP